MLTPQRLSRVLFLLILFSVLAVLPGCSWVRGACSTALPVITKVQSYTHEAQIAVDQAESAFAAMDLPPEVRKEVAVNIARARTAIRVANEGLRFASDACSAPDAFGVLGEFIKVWPAVAALLAKHSDKLGYAPGTQVVADPAIIVEARLRGVL